MNDKKVGVISAPASINISKEGGEVTETLRSTPGSFTEHFAKVLAECVARSIVEKSIRAIHSRQEQTETSAENKVT